MPETVRSAAADASALADLFGRLIPHVSDDEMELGTVKWYDPDKGFGFITPDSGGDELFVHRSSIQMREGRLFDGQRVQFRTKLGTNGKGPRAEMVKITLLPPPMDEADYLQE